MIDASIYRNIQQPQGFDPMAQYAKTMQIRQMVDQGDLAALQRKKMVSDMTREDAFFEEAKNFDPANPETFNRMRQVDPIRAAKFQGDLLDQEEKRGKIAMNASTTFKNNVQTLRDQATKIVDDASLGAYREQVSKLLGPQFAARIPQTFNPKFVQDEVMNADEMLKRNKPEYRQMDIGGALQMVDVNPFTNPAIASMVLNKTMTPGDVQQARDAAAGRAVTMRGQDLTNARSLEQNNIQAGQRTQQGVIELRKEFNGLQEVKNYKEVVPIINSIKSAPNTPAGDLDLIYGVGKILDPNSVVREGEMNLVIKSGSPMQRFAGAASYVMGGGRLTESQRKELTEMLNSRVSGLKANYDAARKTYETTADRQGLPKDQIFVEPPATPSQPAAVTKTIKGKTYVKKEDGWYEQP